MKEVDEGGSSENLRLDLIPTWLSGLTRHEGGTGILVFILRETCHNWEKILA